MLVSKKYTEGDIISFKLSTGEEMVARIAEETDSNYVLEKPCTVMPSAQGMGLIQSLFTADQEKKVSLDKRHVIIHAPSIDAMQKHYIKTTTGIESVTRGSIIT